MVSMEAYKKNPCKICSIPYWKLKSLIISSNMKIIHDDKFDEMILDNYFDRRFFRLIHHLSNIPEFNIAWIKLEAIPSHRNDELVDMINRSYIHSEIRVSADYVRSLSTTQVYCPELWIGAFLDGKLIGSIICDFDREVGEAIIEWLQVLPEYRSKGIASALICKALKTMSNFANFATVSGECDNITNPERVYRHCGFEGTIYGIYLTKNNKILLPAVLISVLRNTLSTNKALCEGCISLATTENFFVGSRLSLISARKGKNKGKHIRFRH